MLLTARTPPFVLFWWSSPSDHSGKIVFNTWANSCAGEELHAIPSVSRSFGNRPHGAGASLRGIWHQASVGTGSRAEQSTCTLEGKRAAWEVTKQKKKKGIRKQAGLADLHPKQASAHLKGNLLFATEAA